MDTTLEQIRSDQRSTWSFAVIIFWSTLANTIGALGEYGQRTHRPVLDTIVGHSPRAVDGPCTISAVRPLSVAPEVIRQRSAYIGLQRKPGDALEGRAFSGKRQRFQRLASVAAGDEHVDADVEIL